jgi:hypothetical protein
MGINFSEKCCYCHEIMQLISLKEIKEEGGFIAVYECKNLACKFCNKRKRKIYS